MLQGSEEWRLARCGSLGASDMPRVLRQIKSGGYSADRANLMAEKLIERLTGVPYEGYRSAAMLQGSEREPFARMTYEIIQGVVVEECGLIRHPTIKGAHASPDGLVGVDGLLELKCPEAAQHCETLTTETIPTGHIQQIGWILACSGRRWCDYVSFNPYFPGKMQIWRQRVMRSEAYVAELEAEAIRFIRELDEKVLKLSRRYGVEDRRSAA